MSLELLDFDNILSDIEVESDINLTTEHLDEVGNSLQLDDDVLRSRHRIVVLVPTSDLVLVEGK